MSSPLTTRKNFKTRQMGRSRLTRHCNTETYKFRHLLESVRIASELATARKNAQELARIGSELARIGQKSISGLAKIGGKSFLQFRRDRLAQGNPGDGRGRLPRPGDVRVRRLAAGRQQGRLPSRHAILASVRADGAEKVIRRAARNSWPGRISLPRRRLLCIIRRFPVILDKQMTS